MLDTVKLRGPKIEDSEAREIELSCVRRSALDLGTGELVYEFTTGNLEGSWDTRVAVRVLRDEWIRLEPTREQPKACAIKVACEPYIEVEGSVHKALLGHNVYGGPEDFAPAVRWFLANISGRIGYQLPDASSWEVLRVDWSECYGLPFEGIEEYIRALNSSEYPRRSVTRYGQESIFAAGSSTAVKAYHKGLEFVKHDRKRLQSALDDQLVDELQQQANEVLRWEVSIKARKLDEDFKSLERKPRVDDISPAYLRRLHDREVQRLVREGEAQMRTVRKQKDVRDRLWGVYDQRLAGVLFGTYLQLSALGEKVTRQSMTRPTFYRQRKQLQEAGVSWHGADVIHVPGVSSLPSDFTPTRRDPRHMPGEDPRVAEQLAPYRAA